MHAKKPAGYITCPRCKTSDFHHPAVDSTTSKHNDYHCTNCGFVVKGRCEKSWKAGRK